MRRSSTTKISGTPFYIVFSDLDGTLLDQESYGWKEAQPALDLCKRLHVPVILTSSKTRAEIECLRHKLSISAPFISENGGGIFFPAQSFDKMPPGASFDNGLWKWSFGLSYAHLVRSLQEIRDELEWDIKGFSDMNIEEISELTGLDQKSSRLASMREFDEPFIADQKTITDKIALHRAAAKRGLTIISGGRFYHLQGKYNKGQAAEKLISWYKNDHENVLSIALGDSENDFAMLERSDFPVLINSQRKFPELKERIPRLRVTREKGPKGWNRAILDILGDKEEKRSV